MANKKVGISNRSNLQGDQLIINNATQSNITFGYTGSNSLTFSLPQNYGSVGEALITDGAGQLTWGTVSAAGDVQSNGLGETPRLAYWTGSYSLSNSDIRQGSGQLLFPGGSDPAPGIAFINDEDTGIKRAANNEIGIVLGGVEVSRFTSNYLQFGDVFYTGTDGVDGQVLAINGSGQTYWKTVVDGVDGATGATGPQGATGLDGATGATGAKGDPGTASVDLGFMYQSGEIQAASFSGTPLIYDVNFVGTFTASYVVNVESLDPRDWTVSNKTTTSFRLHSNSSTTLTQPVYWNAIEQDNKVLGAFIGAVGPQGATGPQGIPGLDGATGATGATGTPQSLSDTLLIGNTASTTILLQDGDVTNPALSFIDDINTGIWRPTANNFTIVTNGVERFRAATTFVRSSLPHRFTDGSVSSPSLTFNSDTDTGIYRVANDQLGITTGGSRRATFGATNSIATRTYFEKAVNHLPIVNSSVSGTYTLNYAEANVWNLTLTGNTTLDYTNAFDGSYIIRIKQDATGGRTLSFTSGKFIAVTTPTISTTANSISLIQIIHIGDKSIVQSVQNLIAI
jgi:hypothetical protein